MMYFAVDSGTTNSRVWLMRDGEVVARRQVSAGVRNTAIDGHNRALMEAVFQAIGELKSDAVGDANLVIAAGMITSNLGLHEVKHMQAPVGLRELAAGIQTRRFDDTGDLLFHFIPGVRTGPLKAELKNVNSIDIMRGEETEICGALQEFDLCGPLLYLHLGSHTKLIQVDEESRIAAGASTLGGEILHSIQQQTILRSSLPETQICPFDEEFFESGWENAERFGMTRALYQVRIFDLNSQFPKDKLWSFVLGIVISEEFRCLEESTRGMPARMIVLSGLPHLQPAWVAALRKTGRTVRLLSAEQTEVAFLAGLFRIFRHYRGSNP